MEPTSTPPKLRLAEPRARRTRPALSIVVPTRDEAENVGPLLARLESLLVGTDFEVIFVDDSDDGTPLAVEHAARRCSFSVGLIHRPAERRAGGLGTAVVEGLHVARAPWVCVMDADLQHPPEIVQQMLKRASADDVDIVVASRFCDGGEIGSFGRLRTALSKTSSSVAGLFFRSRLRRVTDPMSGFFLVRRAAVDPEALRPHGFKILLEILVRTPALRTAEVPFTFGVRHAGESKASVQEAVRYLIQLWRLRFGEFFTRFGRFGLVGASGLVVNTALLAVVTEIGGVHYAVAAVLATQGSTLWNFCFTELWVFSGRDHARRGTRRLAMFFGMNNAALLVRVPLLALLVSTLGMNVLAANVLTLLALFAARYTFADVWIWANSRTLVAEATGFNYDIHGIVSVASEVALPELKRFLVPDPLGNPTIRVRIGRISPGAADKVAVAAPAVNGNGNGNGHSARLCYVEGIRGLGFGADIEVGPRIEVRASHLLRRSPHVLYTNVVEPILRWTFVEKGYALVHAACMADGENAFLITARTDTGKTTTCLKTLDRYPYAFLSDDLILVRPDGRVLTYPKPLTISRHTLHAVKGPLLTRRERVRLVYQSRLHSRSGRRFAMLLAKTHLPAATINAIVQLVVPPPKYQVDRLVPDVEIAPQANIAALMIIQRGGSGEELLEHQDAMDVLMSNCEDAYGFPPYSNIEHFLHSRNGSDLRTKERQIIAAALSDAPSILLRSEVMDWAQRIPPIVDQITTAKIAEAALNGNGNGRHRGRFTRENVLAAAEYGPLAPAPGS